MAQLTYYVAPWDREADLDPEGENTKVRNGTPRLPMQVRHGFTLAQLDRIAALATNTGRTMAMHYQDRRDEAWSAIVEYLYAAETPPTGHELVEVGRKAIYQLIRSDRREQGFYKEHTLGSEMGPGSSPKFQQFWEYLTRPSVSAEGPIVERLALAQILPRLTPRQQEAIHALAVADRYDQAAALIGMTQATFKSHIARGRHRFFELWHEGEIPSGPWGCDRRADRRHDKPRRVLTRRAKERKQRAGLRQAAS
jgi:DNA-directed RNA polymerase specialized sigma24 family protein